VRNSARITMMIAHPETFAAQQKGLKNITPPPPPPPPPPPRSFIYSFKEAYLSTNNALNIGCTLNKMPICLPAFKY